MRLAILAVGLLAAYLLIAKPLLDRADEAVRPATHRLDRLGNCVEHAHGDAHHLFRCAVKR